MDKLLFSFSIIILGVVTGYIMQILYNSKRVHFNFELSRLRINLQKFALLYVMPTTIMSAVWITDLSYPSISALPFVGASAIILGGVFSLGLGQFLKLPKQQAGSFFVCGAFTNVGSIGALICFIFLGEKGFALVPIYKLVEGITYYAIGFPIARQFGPGNRNGDSFVHSLRKTVFDPFILAAFLSIFIGSVLNLSNISRPPEFSVINSYLIPFGTSILLISIGLGLKMRSVTHYLKLCFMVSSIKFVFVPIVITSLAWFIGFGDIQNALALKVVLILSSMPVAFNALVPPSIYNLDLDLANACWLFTTGALIIILPIQLYLISLF